MGARVEGLARPPVQTSQAQNCLSYAERLEVGQKIAHLEKGSLEPAAAEGVAVAAAPKAAASP